MPPASPRPCSCTADVSPPAWARHPVVAPSYVHVALALPKFAPHLLDEVIIAQVNLSLEIFSDPLGSHPISDIFLILPPSYRRPFAELRQQFVGAEPVRRAGCSERGAVAANHASAKLLTEMAEWLNTTLRNAN